MTESDDRRSLRLGTAALVSGVLSAFGSFMIYATSVWLDPPGWVRIPTMALFPIGLLASIAFGVMAMKGPGRVTAFIGWAASLSGLALFVFAIATLG